MQIRSSLSPKRSSAKFFGCVLTGLALNTMVVACSSPNTATNSSPNTANNPATPQAQSNKPIKLTLVSYAVTKTAYENIIPKFVEQWKAQTGQTVEFEQSYGGSGSQTRAVIDGLDADVVALALAGDTAKIEKAGLIQPGWEKELPNDSIVHKSVAALVLRDANLGVKGWSDLTRDDIQVITANPKTSGGAKWNVLALWGSVTQAGGTESEAQSFLETVFSRVPVLPKDAREASDVFYKQGQGNVLINYENEVILASQKGDKQPYIVPTDYNISIDNPVAVVDANVDKHGTRAVAEAFTKFLFTPEAQREFAKVGFRPVEPTVEAEFASQFPKVEKLFTVQDLGGWKQVDTQFFADGAFFDQMQSKIAQSK
ncbi:Sulfate-binding protein [Planktothrix tepida]|uniref:Sulfate-binding protein n=2 Tax=Planktothrix TaxID=54304 RepID=A0A1J1LSP8_9CYAN|nr:MULTISPECIES: sulfate ABC transporter substrate-binding protein [Planktothrix]CAD5952126.1 Sulfate-binding protein [Planktothrix pseudagardhii]CAD5958488.1 Sulfate-binding protein [Planktothrix tepida]CUR34577.1 sulfate transport protein (ABC superfamily, peri_bind) [Planktothrix tepida PCC 9214]